MAITGWSSQETLDILIPVLLHCKEKLLESDDGLANPGQAAQKERNKGKYMIYQKKLQFFPPPTNPTEGPAKKNKGPIAKTKDLHLYVALVTEVGVQSTISQAASVPVIIRDEIIKSTPNLLAIVRTSTVSC